MKHGEVGKIAQVIDNECIKGYAMLAPEIRQSFEKTQLGMRLVSLIQVRLDVGETNALDRYEAPSRWALSLADQMISYLIIWNAKRILAKSLPHLLRIYKTDLQWLHEAVKRSNGEIAMPLGVVSHRPVLSSAFFQPIKYVSINQNGEKESLHPFNL